MEIDLADGQKKFSTPWRSIDEVRMYTQDPEHEEALLRFIHTGCSDQEENFVRDSAWKLFDGHLIGHLYTYHPRG